ncbi:autotransporter outer membrane beta-barrel domain-containing protein, partial [Thermodesulfobacteriota bacterium]
IVSLIFPWGLGGYPSLHHYMIPYDSEHWEGFLKAGLSVGQGPVRVAFTGKGGLILSGENSLMWDLDPVEMDLEGDVDGWYAGADLWLRFMAGGGFSLPFLAAIEYKRKERDGKGTYRTPMGEADAEYDQNEESLQIEAGGGIEQEFSKGSRIAAGAYYQYLVNEGDLFLELIAPNGATINFDQYNCPDSDEHRIALKIAGEMRISRAFSFLIGAGGFFGWVDYDIATNVETGINGSDNVEMDGTRWGVSASLGGSINAGSIIIEPFITGAYTELHLDGEGPILYPPSPSTDVRVGMENDKDEFLVGGGVSVIFN